MIWGKVKFIVFKISLIVSLSLLTASCWEERITETIDLNCERISGKTQPDSCQARVDVFVQVRDLIDVESGARGTKIILSDVTVLFEIPGIVFELADNLRERLSPIEIEQNIASLVGDSKSFETIAETNLGRHEVRSNIIEYTCRAEELSPVKTVDRDGIQYQAFLSKCEHSEVLGMYVEIEVPRGIIQTEVTATAAFVELADSQWEPGDEVKWRTIMASVENLKIKI